MLVPDAVKVFENRMRHAVSEHDRREREKLTQRLRDQNAAYEKISASYTKLLTAARDLWVVLEKGKISKDEHRRRSTQRVKRYG